MSDVAAIDGANPIEDTIALDIALLDDKAGLSTSNQKVEEEGSPHAISAAIIHNEDEANAAEALQLVQAAATAAPSTKTEERSPLIGKPGRYKNPILAIFATMSVARKTMQDVAKSSKEETRLMKKHWERISHDVSDHYGTAADASENIKWWSDKAGMLFGIVPAILPMGISADQDKYNWWTEIFDGLAHTFSDSFTPSEFIKGTVPNKEKLVEKINWFAQSAQKFAEPSINQWGQSTQMANQRDVAVGQQQSDASRTEYQSRQDEKRNEDEAVKTIDQMTQRLMEQEVRAFEVRG